MNTECGKEMMSLLETLEPSVNELNRQVFLKLQGAIKTYLYLKKLASVGIISFCSSGINTENSEELYYAHFESIDSKLSDLLNFDSPLPLSFEASAELTYKFVVEDEA